MKMELPEYKERDLLISDSINQSTVGNIINKIFEINLDDDKKEAMFKDWERKPIRLFINTYGGGVYAGLALVDVIKQSKTPVHTICIGSCMSMGLWIWLAGAKKLVGENSTLMFHDLTTSAMDKTEGIIQELAEMKRLQKVLIKTILENSDIKEETLKDYVVRKAEWYIPAKDAIKLSLADDYYKVSEA